MNRLPLIAQRLFNVPLAIHPRKLEVIVAGVGHRFGLTGAINLDGIEIGLQPMAMEDDDYAAPRAPARGYDVVAGVALIQVAGTLVHKLGTLRPYSGMTGYDGIRQNLFTAMADPKVRAIAFLIDSPGGEVAGCFDLVDAIHASRGDKPIWSILDESAYSAAYAIASATDRIVVPRTGGTGSVGVIAMHVDWSKALSDGGVKVTFISYGDRKTDGWPQLPLSKEALQRFQADIDAQGELFVETVARNRKMAVAAVRKTQAGTFMGEAGVETGFADAVLAPDAAFNALLQSLG